MPPSTTTNSRARWRFLMGLCWGLWAGTAGAGGGTHWAFESIRPVVPPQVRRELWVANPVDRFILSRIEAAKLTPAASAKPEQLVRRCFLGLTGLPPTPEELDAFASDTSPDAVDRLVDRLLASPRYGERWGRHWLDLARYAETDGFEHDAVRPHTWRYRDYVVRAFNADKSFDRFLLEQIAGDELWPEDPDAVIATGFNLLGPDMVDSSDQVQRRLNTLNDMTDTVASVCLGLTLGCARCHDHKFEPFSQRDYFSFQAFFAPAEYRREHPVPSPSLQARQAALRAEYDARTQVARDAIQAIEGPRRRSLFEAKLAALSEDVQSAHRTAAAQRTKEQEATVAETAPQLTVTEAEVLRALSPDQRAERALWVARLEAVPKPAPLPLSMALHNTTGSIPSTHVLARGDYNNPRVEVSPQPPAVLVGPGPGWPSFSEPGRQRRSALAGWIASPRNPLTARVIVNRVWQHWFGRGLVATPSDFGTHGEAPTHPELLDWLAGDFVAHGWSLKHLHRTVLRSSTWRQSVSPAPESAAGDPENRLYTRMNRMRLEGEVIRDSLLAVSGRLNARMEGPSVSPPIAPEITRTSKNWTVSADPSAHHRRSLYIFARRNLRFPFLEAFDAPDSNLSCAARGRSTTAPQALTLLNSEEVMEAARSTAAALERHSASPQARIERGYQLILARRPSPGELQLAAEFIQGSPLSELCRALFNLNAFVYLD